jgi:hypothetical protein
MELSDTEIDAYIVPWSIKREHCLHTLWVPNPMCGVWMQFSEMQKSYSRYPPICVTVCTVVAIWSLRVESYMFIRFFLNFVPSLRFESVLYAFDEIKLNEDI